MIRPLVAGTVLAAMLSIGCAKQEEVQQAPAEQPAPTETPAPPPVDSAAIRDSIAKAKQAAEEAEEAAKPAKKKAVIAKTGELKKSDPAKVEKESAPTQQIRKSR
jgi:hypothetical protein